MSSISRIHSSAVNGVASKEKKNVETNIFSIVFFVWFLKSCDCRTVNGAAQFPLVRRFFPESIATLSIGCGPISGLRIRSPTVFTGRGRLHSPFHANQPSDSSTTRCVPSHFLDHSCSSNRILGRALRT